MIDLEVVERPAAVYSHQRVQVCMGVTWDGAVVLLDPSPATQGQWFGLLSIMHGVVAKVKGS